MTIDLYCFGESGNAYKCALMLQLSGLPWRPIWVDFFRGAARRPEFLAINPMGEVPVLQDGDLRLTQSGVILDYLAEKTGRYGGTTPEEKREILRWILWDNHKLSGQIGMTRFLANFLAPEKRPQPVIDFHQARLKGTYGILNTHLASRDWLAGPGPSIADFSCCSYLYYPEPFGFDRHDWPHIARWLEAIAALPGWKHPYDLMPGCPADRASSQNT